MQKAVFYGIIAAIVIAGSVGVAFGLMSINNTPAANQQSQQPSDVRVIKHALGDTQIIGTPERVVVIELNSVQLLYELGIEPIGLGSLEFWRDATPEIIADWSDTVDVGANFEPNLETISRLEPDLIIGMSLAHSEIYDDLSSIAPTILLNNYPPEGGPTMLEATREGTMMVADALNKHADGRAILERLDARIEENAAKIRAAGLGGKKFVLAETFVFDQPGITLLLPNSQSSEILEMMGLKNVVPVPREFQRFGSVDTSLEGLSSLDGPDVYFIYKTIPGTKDPLAEGEYWKDNPVWNGLSFVRDGRVYSISEDDYMSFYGGVIDLEKISNKITRAISFDSDVRVIKHKWGEMEIAGTPTRIVVLSVVNGQMLLQLGVQPVGADLVDYGYYSPRERYDALGLPLSEDVVDVGDGFEPNLENIAQLEPDLILAEIYTETLYNKLSEIAPTLPNPFPLEGDSLDSVEQDLMKIADALNRHDYGVKVMDEFYANLDELAARIESAGLKGSKFVIAQTTMNGATPTIQVLGENNAFSDALERIGLTNAIGTTGDYGAIRLSLEGVTTLDGPDVHFLYFDFRAMETIEQSVVWQGLEFVQEGKVYKLGENQGNESAPRSIELGVEQVVEALTENNP